mmetsp:Transcript_164/g.435  ORF Transcript_164/g.435 Transcript_164/m.435 type:complete len:233 (-) Transcript_164:385-1083(-)
MLLVLENSDQFIVLLFHLTGNRDGIDGFAFHSWRSVLIVLPVTCYLFFACRVRHIDQSLVYKLPTLFSTTRIRVARKLETVLYRSFQIVLGDRSLFPPRSPVARGQDSVLSGCLALLHLRGRLEGIGGRSTRFTNKLNLVIVGLERGRRSGFVVKHFMHDLAEVQLFLPSLGSRILSFDVIVDSFQYSLQWLGWLRSSEVPRAAGVIDIIVDVAQIDHVIAVGAPDVGGFLH